MVESPAPTSGKESGTACTCLSLSHHSMALFCFLSYHFVLGGCCLTVAMGQAGHQTGPWMHSVLISSEQAFPPPESGFGGQALRTILNLNSVS